MGQLVGQVDRGRVALFDPERFGQQRRLPQMPDGPPDQDNHIAGLCGAVDHVAGLRDQPDPADGGGGQDARAVGFVIERDIARDDGEGKGGAGGTDALDRAHQLPHDLRLFGVAEVQVVGGGQGGGPHGDQVAIRLCHGLFAAFERVSRNIARGHVRGEGDGFGRAVDPGDP